MTLETEELEENEDLQEETAEEATLSGRQRLWVVLAGLLSFLFFSFLFFPFEGILRSVLQGLLPPQVRLDFSTVKLGFAGATTVEDLQLRGTDGLYFETEQLAADLKTMALLRRAPQGVIRLKNGSFSAGRFSGTVESVDLTLNMRNMSLPLSQWEGVMQWKIRGMQPEQLPDILNAIPASPQELSIQQLSLPLRFQNGIVDFGQTQLQTSVFVIRLEGTGRLGRSAGQTSLDGRVCLRPVDDLETKNEPLYSLYIMSGGTAGGELCMKMTGTLARPNIQPIERQPAQ